jgi:hypothetical protein
VFAAQALNARLPSGRGCALPVLNPALRGADDMAAAISWALVHAVRSPFRLTQFQVSTISRHFRRHLHALAFDLSIRVTPSLYTTRPLPPDRLRSQVNPELVSLTLNQANAHSDTHEALQVVQICRALTAIAECQSPNARPRLARLEFQITSLGTPADVDALCRLLRASAALEVLDLRDCHIVRAHMVSVAESVAHCASLTCLSIGNNDMRGDRAWPAMCRAVERLANLRALNAGHTKIEPASVTALANMLATNPTLKWLCLRGCPIGNAGVHALAAALGENATLTYLSVAAVNADCVGVDSLARVAGTHGSLQTLVLASNQMGDAPSHDNVKWTKNTTRIQSRLEIRARNDERDHVKETAKIHGIEEIHPCFKSPGPQDSGPNLGYPNATL